MVPARDYVSHFASDRSHMLKGGEWLAAPPAYPCIVAQQGGCTNNINRCVQCDKARGGNGPDDG